jgi:hypothetical protein
MAEDNIVDFKTRAKVIVAQKKKKAVIAEDDPLREFFKDDDIIDIFMSTLMFLRHTSTSQTVDLRLEDDRLVIEAKNLVDYEVKDIDTEQSLNKIASMDLTDDDGEELPAEVLVKLFQQCVEAIIIETDEEDEPEKTD